MPSHNFLRGVTIFAVTFVLFTAISSPARAQKAKPKSGGRAVELFNAGVKFQNQGQIDEAIAKYTEAIAVSPTEFQALANRGGLYRVQAIELRESSIGLDPTAKAAAMAKVDELFNLAIADYDAAIKVAPKGDFLYHDRAAVQVARGKIDLAIADYDEFIKRKPTEPRGYNDRGTAYIELAKAERASERSAEAGLKKATPDLEKANADFTKAIELDPKFVLGYVNRASGSTQLLKLDEALADYAKAIEISPDYWRAYRGRSEIYRALSDDSKRSGDKVKAAEYLALQQENTAKYVELQSKPAVTPTPAPKK